MNHIQQIDFDLMKWLFIFEALIASIVSMLLAPVVNWSQAWIPFVTFVVAYFALIALFFVYIFVLSLFWKNEKLYYTQNKFVNLTVNFTLKLLLELAHVHLKVTGKEKLPKDHKYCVVYNHTSNWDPMIESWVLRKDDLVHISKPSNFNIPIAGPMVKRNCYLPIDRENNRKAIETILAAAEFLKQNKYCVGISPEGTRNKVDAKTLLPFRDGAFNLPIKGEAPIVVVELYNANKIAKNFPFRPTHVEMNIIDVISYEEAKELGTQKLSLRVHEELQNKINSRFVEENRS